VVCNQEVAGSIPVRSIVTNRTGERVSSALAIAGLSAIALAVRLLVALRGGLWRDEALFLSVTTLPSWKEMLDFLRLYESHPPLFYALMRLWISAFGDTDVRSVILPVVFGVALVPVIYLVGRSLFSKRVGLLAAALAALSPALTEYSATARPYSLMPLLALLSTYTLIRGLQRGTVRIWATHGVSTVALLYTHNWGWLVLFGEWMSILVVLSFHTTRPPAARVNEWIAAQGAIGIAYLPWAPTLLEQIRHAGHAPWAMELRSDFIASLATSVHLLTKATITAYSPVDPIGGRSMSTLFFALPLILLAVDQYLRARSASRAANGANQGSKIAQVAHDNRIAIVCILVVPIGSWVAALVLSSTSNLMLTQCLVTLAPLSLLALAYWVQRPRVGAMRLVTGAATFAFVLTYTVSLYELSQTSRSNARGLASAVALRTQPTDLMVIAPEWLASSFNRYFRESVEQIDYPHFGREERIGFTDMLPRFRDEAAANRARERIRQARENGRRVWLITDPDGSFPSSPVAIRRLLGSPRYGLVALGRTHELRSQLDTLYGSPESTIVAASLVPRYEEIRASLYAPRDRKRH
jgi:uncharacterized membrane protein